MNGIQALYDNPAWRGFESLPRYHRYYETGPGLFRGMGQVEDAGQIAVEIDGVLAGLSAGRESTRRSIFAHRTTAAGWRLSSVALSTSNKSATRRRKIPRR